MDEKQVKAISKFLSYVLRHHPEEIGIVLDENGWTDVNLLLHKMADRFAEMDRPMLEYVVRTNLKKRFVFNETGERIRASQGHSVEVNLGYAAVQPPAVLYHGTAERFAADILTTGLHKKGRHHVHLTASMQNAREVGARHGRPVVFIIDAAKMSGNGFSFYLSENGVWLTDNVPADYLTTAGIK